MSLLLCHYQTILLSARILIASVSFSRINYEPQFLKHGSLLTHFKTFRYNCATSILMSSRQERRFASRTSLSTCRGAVCHEQYERRPEIVRGCPRAMAAAGDGRS